MVFGVLIGCDKIQPIQKTAMLISLYISNFIVHIKFLGGVKGGDWGEGSSERGLKLGGGRSLKNLSKKTILK